MHGTLRLVRCDAILELRIKYYLLNPIFMLKEHMLPLELKSPAEITLDVAKRLRARRLEANLSQEGLALRSGVTVASLKRFERTGKIAFDSLAKLAFALGAADGFDKLFLPPEYTSLDQVLGRQRKRSRGSLK